MEYSKETENFSFGFGTDKLVGNKNINELHTAKNDDKSDKQEIVEVSLSAAAVVGITLLKIKFSKNKKAKKKKRNK